MQDADVTKHITMRTLISTIRTLISTIRTLISTIRILIGTIRTLISTTRTLQISGMQDAGVAQRNPKLKHASWQRGR